MRNDGAVVLIYTEIIACNMNNKQTTECIHTFYYMACIDAIVVSIADWSDICRHVVLYVCVYYIYICI